MPLFKRKTFNDTLALVLVVLYVGLWAVHGLKYIAVPEVVLGATVAHTTMVVTYYFRKAPPNGETKP